MGYGFFPVNLHSSGIGAGFGYLPAVLQSVHPSGIFIVAGKIFDWLTSDQFIGRH
jgi:hypothetical protein